MPENTNKDKLSNYSVDLGAGFNGRAFLCGPVDEECKLDSTVSLFVLFDSVSNSASGFQNMLFSRARPGFGNPSSNFGVRLEREATGFRIKASYGPYNYISNTTISSQNLYSYDVYHHIAITLSYTGSAYNFTIWVDGVADVPSQSPVTMSPLGLPPSSSAPHNFCIGGVGNATTIRTQETFYDGNVAQCSIFDYALDSTQISYLNQGNNPMAMTDPPKLYWPLADNMNINTASNITYAPNTSVGADSVFDFGGSNDYINLGDVTYLDGASELTLSAWVNPTSHSGNILDAIFSKDGPTRGFHLGLATGNKFRFLVSTTGTTVDVFNSNASYTNGKWYHLAATWDGSNMKIYINGSEDNSITTTNATGTLQNNANPFEIGDNGNYHGPLDGFLSNAQIWNTDLTGPEVTTLYNNGQPLMTGTQPQAANLKAWYKLNQTDSYWDLGGNGKWTFNNAAIN